MEPNNCMECAYSCLEGSLKCLLDENKRDVNYYAINYTKPSDCELDKHKGEDIPKEKDAHWLPRKVQRRGETRHWMCSRCKRDVWLDTVRLENPYNYCPWCGAKMEHDEVCYD